MSNKNCARCGRPGGGTFQGGTLHRDYLFCASRECYAVSLLLRYTRIVDVKAFTASVCDDLIALPLGEVARRLMAFRALWSVWYGKCDDETWTWIEAQVNVDEEESEGRAA